MADWVNLITLVLIVCYTFKEIVFPSHFLLLHHKPINHQRMCVIKWCSCISWMLYIEYLINNKLYLSEYFLLQYPNNEEDRLIMLIAELILLFRYLYRCYWILNNLSVKQNVFSHLFPSYIIQLIKDSLFRSIYLYLSFCFWWGSIGIAPNRVIYSLSLTFLWDSVGPWLSILRCCIHIYFVFSFFRNSWDYS